MTGGRRYTFVNYDSSNSRPTPRQRQTVSAYIGRHFRNRSAPTRRQQPHGDDNSEKPHSGGPSSGAPGQLVIRDSLPGRSSRQDGRCAFQEGGAGLQAPGSLRSGPRNTSFLLRPVVECFVPAYPTEHRQKVSNILDFHIHYLAARLSHWGTGPTPFMRCWVQMVCGDIVLFDSLAAFTHGVRLTTLEDKVTPNAAMLWHKARALKGLQAKISTLAEDKEAIWTANETILAIFYLMEGAARFGLESEYKSHCLGLLQMMQLRGEVASACLKDLYVMQAAGLVEGTEMASELRRGITQGGHQSSHNKPSTITSITKTSVLTYFQPGLQLEESLRAMVDTLPVGFRDLIALGNLSVEFILLLNEQLREYDSLGEAAEQQTKGVRRARLLANQSQNAVERLACLGVVAFLSRRTVQMQMFPEVSLINKMTMLGRQIVSSGQTEILCYHELRVWVTLAGAEIAATAGATLKQNTHDAMMELLLQERWVGGWNDVERIARRYLWDEKTLTAWKEYWMSYADVGEV